MVYVAAGLMLVMIMLVLIRSGYERRHFAVEHFLLETEKLDEGEEALFVFLSDLHDNEFGPGNQELVKAIRTLKPDFILVGGDMMVCKGKQDIRIALELMEALSALCPIYYANGNHEVRMRKYPDIYGDQYEVYQAALQSLGIHYLENATAKYRLQTGGCIEIGGVDLERRHYKKFVRPVMAPEFLAACLGAANPDNLQITMIHSPLFSKEASGWGSDLVLSGHFHGGTVRVPGYRGLMSPQFQFFPKYGGGEYDEYGIKMIVSRGLGTHSINLRINNRSQLVVVDIKGRHKEERK